MTEQQMQRQGEIKMRRRIQAGVLVVALVCAPFICNAMVLGLRKNFIESVENKTTITTRFQIEALPANGNPHPISEDGDIHMAGRDSVVQLPIVAEIINARKETAQLAFLKNLAKQDPLTKEVDLTGVWRLWFEHPSPQPQIQGQSFPRPEDSGMPHVFELHPVTTMESFDCRNSFVPIESGGKKFNGNDADAAFKDEYDTLKAEITIEGDMVKIKSGRGTLNYANFVMQLAAMPNSVGDGAIVSAQVFKVGEDDAPVVPRKIRMVFAKDTEPAKKLKGLVKGDRLHVLGVPRVNLHAVLGIVNKLKPNETWKGPLPYEMIIVAVYPKLDTP
jgi:hypothetical protein